MTMFVYDVNRNGTQLLACNYIYNGILLLLVNDFLKDYKEVCWSRDKLSLLLVFICFNSDTVPKALAYTG